MEEKSYFYIDNDGNQQGPRYVSQLKTDNIIHRSTLVWCNGMSDWQRAFSVEDFNNFWFDENQPPPPPSFNEPREEPKQEPTPVEPTRKKPHSWLIESIVATFILFFITGLIGLIFSLLFERRWKEGRYDEAEKASKIAKNMFFVSLGLSCFIGIIILLLFFSPFFIALFY